MDTLSEIKKPLNQELKSFRQVFRNAVRSNVPLLDVIMQYILRSKGKQIRPLFVLYTADMLGRVNEVTHRAATLIELLHTATLVHDDVVDNSYKRRGMFSVNYLWRNKIAVLAGDYLLSRGMILALENGDHAILTIVSRAVKEMSEGELLQLEKARKLDIDEEIYYRIIKNKTASLIASCMAAGAASVTDDEEIIEKMYRIGEQAGMAFQIKDDLFDLEFDNSTGKPPGIDIKEKKMTLPLIYLLSTVSSAEKRKIIKVVSKHGEDNGKVEWLVRRINDSGGVAYAREKMGEFKNDAVAQLMEFPESQAREALLGLIEYVTERRK